MSSSVHKPSPALPGGRLAFERAIRRSGLPAPARHVALTIATWADISSGVIPERFQPSISTIAEATGLSTASVKRHLGVLEAEGWLVRDRPEISRARREHARTKYELALPESARELGSERAMPIAQTEPSHSSEGARAWPTVSHKSSCSSDEVPNSPTSSPAGPSETEPTAGAGATDGGGGGDSDLRSTAIHIAASLDYCDQVLDKQQQAKLTTAVLAALVAGWSARGLARYLFLDGYRPDNPVAFYLSKLSPKKLPDAAPAEVTAGLTRDDVFGPARSDSADGGLFDRAMARAQRRMTGAGSAAGGHTPFRNYDDDSVYDEPWTVPAAPKPPWCGDPDCSETDRMREVEDAAGFKFAKRCEKCHPDRARAA